MLFNSIAFIVFFGVVFIAYWFIFNKQLKWQNTILLIGSYIFYGWWDYRFLFLLIFSTALDFYTGIQIHSAINQQRKKTWLWISVGMNLLFLGFLKYYNFFVDNFIEAFDKIGISLEIETLQIILPVGISFYTFHGLSYVIDIYYNRCKPTTQIIDYGLFVSYFPLLVAGPIERATHLLPQIQTKRVFHYSQAVDGIKLMLWGFFKKIVIADTLASIVNPIYADYHHYSGLSLIVAAVFFSFQIYCDFSGYSDIARGVSKLLGIELLLNFNFPYLSRSIAEFWRRWHISLSTWFRDYVYIPLGGSKVSKTKIIRNLIIIFLISGFWHGANWTFIIWGSIHALLYIPSVIRGNNRVYLSNAFHNNRYFPSLKETLQIIVTFLWVTGAWIFFRSVSVDDAFQFINQIFSKPGLHLNHIKTNTHLLMNIKGVVGIIILLTLELYMYTGTKKIPLWVYYILLILIAAIGSFRDSISFIYFQF